MPNIINNQGLPYPQIDNYFTVEDTENGPYTRGGMAVEYLWESGQLQLAVAETPRPPGQGPVACEIVQAHAPVGQMIIRWAAMRDVNIPLLPNPYSANSNLSLSFMQICSQAPQLTSDGVNRTYKVWGLYVYFLAQPVFVPVDGGWMGWAPWDKVAPQLNIISANNFRQVF